MKNNMKMRKGRGGDDSKSLGGGSGLAERGKKGQKKGNTVVLPRLAGFAPIWAQSPS